MPTIKVAKKVKIPKGEATIEKKATEEQLQKFLEAIAESPNFKRAAENAGVGRSTMYGYLADDPEFAKKYNRCLEMGYGAFQDYSLDVAMGKEKADKGAITLIIFHLKAMYPEKYKERSESNNNVKVSYPLMINIPRDEQQPKLQSGTDTP